MKKSSPEKNNKLVSSGQIIRSFKAKADAKRSASEKLADFLTQRLGSISFLIANLTFFTVWILINTGQISQIKIFDPFPFGFLTMLVSLEAIILAIFVLISQNREARVFDLREETDLEVDVITEREITKVLTLLIKLLEKNGIDVSSDPELKQMLKPTSADEIEAEFEKEI